MSFRDTNIENTHRELGIHIEELINERNHWHQIAHDLYMAAAHGHTCKTCRERSLDVMRNYEQSPHPKDKT